MATKFSEIYEKAIWKVRDYDSLIRTAESSEQMYFHLLLSAISDIQHYAPVKLTFKEVEEAVEVEEAAETEEAEEVEEAAGEEENELPPKKEHVFDEELSFELQDLLALGVAVKWLEPHFLNSDALKKGMFNKDYKDFGIDADKIAEIYHGLRRLFEGKAKTMSFRYSNFERLKPGGG